MKSHLAADPVYTASTRASTVQIDDFSPLVNASDAQLFEYVGLCACDDFGVVILQETGIFRNGAVSFRFLLHIANTCVNISSF